MNVILRKDATKSDLAQFHHGSLFSTVTSTILESINSKHLITWPEISDKFITKHLLPSLATAKGHQNQESHRIQSTKLPKSYDNQIKVITINTLLIKFIIG